MYVRRSFYSDIRAIMRKSTWDFLVVTSRGKSIEEKSRCARELLKKSLFTMTYRLVLRH